MLRIFLYCIACCCIVKSVAAQEKIKIAVFTPLYLDSAFNNTQFKLGNAALPKYMLPGLEFYNGIQMAIDSLEAEGKEMEVLIYDSKLNESFANICNEPVFNNVALIIANFNNRNEVKQLADIAFKKQIPLISATYPNDGGVAENPFFVMLNTSLKTHIDEIYKHLQRQYATSNIVYIKKKGSLENILQSYFSSAAKTTAAIALKYATVELNDGFSADQVSKFLDSNKKNTIICGSLDETFGTELVRNVASLKAYSTTIIGMPTWDNVKELDKADCKGVTIVYTSSFWFNNNILLSSFIQKKYRQKQYLKPSDWVFKGFEVMYYFGSIAHAFPTESINHLSDRKFKCFNEFNIQPLKNSAAPATIKYLENQKLYFIKKVDGQVTQVL